MTLNNPERLVIDLEGKWQIKATGAVSYTHLLCVKCVRNGR